ncbi:MAG: segregation/condensation protein A, partial [Clostridia bacterium]|nr:segregation/condensation protein A [Clostridia bacterium]
MEQLKFSLEVFDGPLELLLHLISKNKVSIYDIPISLILEQYMDYIEDLKKMDLEVSSAFIEMAAQLMLIKSRMLLPKAETEEEDPRMSLAEALAEYKRYKAVIDPMRKNREN